MAYQLGRRMPVEERGLGGQDPPLPVRGLEAHSRGVWGGGQGLPELAGTPSLPMVWPPSPSGLPPTPTGNQPLSKHELATNTTITSQNS